MFSSGAGSDQTDYSKCREVPEVALRAMFQHEKLDEKIRIALAGKGLTTVRKFAMLGQTEERFEAKIKAIMGDELGADAAEIEANVTFIGVVWMTAQKTMEFDMNQRARLQEDSSKVPELSMIDVSDMRERFFVGHPDLVLTESNEPHKKFIEKVNRDLVVNGVLLFYELIEVRVKKDKVVSSKVFAKTAEDLLKMTQGSYDTAELTTDEDAMGRIQAFLIMNVWLGVNEWRSVGYNENDEDGCGLSYWSTLIEKRTQFAKDHGCSPFVFTVIADRKIRRKVAELMYNKRAKFPTFKAAMKEVLREWRHLWRDAVDEARLKVAASATAPQTPPKRPREEQGHMLETPESKAEKTLADLKARKRDKRKARLAKAKAKKSGSNAGQGSGGSSGGGNAGAPADTREPVPRVRLKPNPSAEERVPAELFTKVNKMARDKRKCTFFNLNKCNKGAQCPMAHACCQCGGGHAYVDRHQ